MTLFQVYELNPEAIKGYSLTFSLEKMSAYAHAHIYTHTYVCLSLKVNHQDE